MEAAGWGGVLLTKTAFDKISEGLAEALEIARGDAKPQRLYEPKAIERANLGIPVWPWPTKLARQSIPKMSIREISLIQILPLFGGAHVTTQ
jgi:hypothetical protein